MKMRKILLGVIVSIAILWASIFLFVQYKTDSFIQKFSPDEVQISYDRIYVKFGITHPLTIIIKNIQAISDGVKFHTNLHLYPSFSNMIVKMDLSVNNKDDHLSIPIIVTTKKSKNKNFYLATFHIDNASFIVNGSRIALDGGIEFYQDRLPLGGYNISISDTQKLLDSNLLKQYPKILYRTQKILNRIDSRSPKFRLDYTESGMKLDGVPVENL